MIHIKYALISDVHGNLPALEAVIQDAMKNDVDHYIFLGDYCIGLAYPNEVVDYIRSIEPAFVVSGNEDEAFMHYVSYDLDKRLKGQFEASPWIYKSLSERNRSYLCKLPQEIVIKRDNYPPIFAFHKPQRYFNGTSPCLINPQYFASGVDEKKFDSESYGSHFHAMLNCDTELHAMISKLEKGVYIFGHTHIPFHWEREGKLVINPGSCGLPLDFNQNASYAILEWTGNNYTATIKRIVYDVNTAINYTKNSVYAKEVRVWSGIIVKELETAREQAVPFVNFTEKYAADNLDMVRPFCAQTWYAAYDAWCKIQR